MMVGKIKYAPGTIASFVACLLFILLMNILSSFLDKSGVETESTVIETILSKLKSNDKVILYIDGAAMPDRQGAGIGGVCYKSKKKIF